MRTLATLQIGTLFPQSTHRIEAAPFVLLSNPVPRCMAQSSHCGLPDVCSSHCLVYEVSLCVVTANSETLVELHNSSDQKKVLIASRTLSQSTSHSPIPRTIFAASDPAKSRNTCKQMNTRYQQAMGVKKS
ncbi:hypothetical protein CYLTODRAFT_227762 [Cylindrobasidium torrendii FP15055 ss-10]|uniref:Uncharacterized protein n=1 Tax=Cylindrobasidium torrendii FP15055 ss-10 TaxID=1314674 RepID=A0A0D7BFU5_9AGAR|nr:hypothetical protein CYLTODRAFT_227762 [Cylindrobasidium torrendii FP15055 ss-10]